MDKKSTILVIIFTFSFVIIMALTAYLTSGISPIKSSATKKRFSAPAGKSMEKSLVLVSKNRENTFSEESPTSSEESRVKDIQVSSIDKDNGNSKNLKEFEKSNQSKNVSQHAAVKISDELKDLLLSSSNPLEQTDELNRIVESIKDSQKTLKILNNNLDILISKGLDEWVETKLNEIISSSPNDTAIVSEANLMLAQVEIKKGNQAKAEELLKKSWESLTSSNPKENEELVRLVGLNYARILLQNKNEDGYKEIIQFMQKNFPQTSK